MADAFHHRDGKILQKLTDAQVAHRLRAYRTRVGQTDVKMLYVPPGSRQPAD